MTEQEVKQKDIKQFLAGLQQFVQRDDRAALADLRRGFSPGTEYRAWPYIVDVCDLRDDRQRQIWLTIAAGFATHKGTDPEAGNIGSTLRKLAKGQPGKSEEEALKSFDARFRRLLTCDDTIELCERLRGVIRAAERKGITINYERLFWDLQKWHKPDAKVKICWAQSYWGQEQ